MMIRNILVLILFALLSITIKAQTRKPASLPNAKEAKDNFSSGNYIAALPEYLGLIKKESDNALYHYRAGICHLNINGDKKQAIPYLERAVKLSENKMMYYDLGKAYHLAYRFDDAIEAFKKHKEAGNKAEPDTDRQIEICLQAKELIKFPQKVTFENLGKDINSPYPDYYPFTTEDESMLVFTSRRKGTFGGLLSVDGYFTSDIFMSNEKNAKWGKAKSIGNIVNTVGDDAAVGLSADGKVILIYAENAFEYGDISASFKKGNSFQMKQMLDKNVNSSDLEVAATISPDGNSLIFSSNRSGGQGELDLYISRKLPTGKWGVPSNMGATINTAYNEDFPIFSPDGYYLYFASQGHNTIGGFDLFKTYFDEKKQEWTKPVNIGYPINTPEDNFTISFAGNGKKAYVSMWREDSFGDLDIYEVTFEGVDPVYTAVKGLIKAEEEIDTRNFKTFYVYKKDGIVKEFSDEYLPSDSQWSLLETKRVEVKEGFEYRTIVTFEKNGAEVNMAPSLAGNDNSMKFRDVRHVLVKKETKPGTAETPITKSKIIDVKDARITVTEKKSGNIFGYYGTHPSIPGSFLMILPPGLYIMKIEADGCDPYTEELAILDKASFKPEVLKEITLKKKKAIIGSTLK
jgi:tetratricopeptide (TPR) repeat protein